jgi:apolipoprotein N-acyltransferase
MALGVLLALGHAPFNMWFLSFVAICLCILQIEKQKERLRIALYIMFFGIGYFIVTLNWIVEPFFVDFLLHAWIAPFAIFSISIAMSLFWFVFSYVFAPMGARWALVLGIAIAEYFRSFVFTGFPWGTIASLFVSSPFAQLLSLVGPFGLGLLVFAIVMFLVSSLESRKIVSTFVGLFILSSMLFWGLQRQNLEIEFTDKTILLVQPNAPQSEKWNEDLAPVFFNRMIKSTAEANKVSLIVWPESAIYYPLNFADELVKEISKASSGIPVAFGALRFDENKKLLNSLILHSRDEKQQIYDKSILVPFGEYLPLSYFLSNLGLSSMVNSYGAGFTPGPGAALIEVDSDFYFQPLICYEAIFPSILRATSSRPDLVLQITNDAWFGRFSGPYQHLQILKMRAIETGVPVARSANTGISAVISATGKIIESLPLETQGSLELNIPKALNSTVYYNWGENIFFIMFLSLMLFGIIVKRHY